MKLFQPSVKSKRAACVEVSRFCTAAATTPPNLLHPHPSKASKIGLKTFKAFGSLKKSDGVLFKHNEFLSQGTPRFLNSKLNHPSSLRTIKKITNIPKDDGSEEEEKIETITENTKRSSFCVTQKPKVISVPNTISMKELSNESKSHGTLENEQMGSLFYQLFDQTQ